jgi:hypothetical protein
MKNLRVATRSRFWRNPAKLDRNGDTELERRHITPACPDLVFRQRISALAACWASSRGSRS